MHLHTFEDNHMTSTNTKFTDAKNVTSSKIQPFIKRINSLSYQLKKAHKVNGDQEITIDVLSCKNTKLLNEQQEWSKERKKYNDIIQRLNRDNFAKDNKISNLESDLNRYKYEKNV